MLANLLDLIAGRSTRRYDYETGFVRSVRVRARRPRNRKVEIIIAVCWILIAVKTVFVFWACRRYRIPFSPLWVVVPTIVFAALCTGIYVFRRR